MGRILIRIGVLLVCVVWSIEGLLSRKDDWIVLLFPFALSRINCSRRSVRSALLSGQVDYSPPLALLSVDFSIACTLSLLGLSVEVYQLVKGACRYAWT